MFTIDQIIARIFGVSPDQMKAQAIAFKNDAEATIKHFNDRLARMERALIELTEIQRATLPMILETHRVILLLELSLCCEARTTPGFNELQNDIVNVDQNDYDPDRQIIYNGEGEDYERNKSIDRQADRLSEFVGGRSEEIIARWAENTDNGRANGAG